VYICSLEEEAGDFGGAADMSADPKLGHNGGPELEDDDPTGRLLFVKWAWTRAHDEVWKSPPLDILRFRVARAEAAGLTYRQYMLQLLDSGRYPQAKLDDADSTKPKRPLAKPGPPAHGNPGPAPVRTTPSPTAGQASTGVPATPGTSPVDSRVGHARQPSPLIHSGLRKVHK
jgi:hypothetical protein